MDTTDTDDICREMEQVRCSLGAEVEEIVESARTLTSWRYYVNTFPWLCVAGAAAAGFFLVPKRVEVVKPDADVLENLARRKKLVLESNPQPKPARGIGAALVGIIAHAVIREGMGLLRQNAGRVFRPVANSGAREGEGNGDSHH